jgi:hypothetical protein
LCSIGKVLEENKLQKVDLAHLLLGSVVLGVVNVYCTAISCSKKAEYSLTGEAFICTRKLRFAALIPQKFGKIRETLLYTEINNVS